jgi:hypothetical protein
MEVYFRVIRQNVVPLARYSTYRRDSLHPPAVITGTHPQLLHEAVRELERPPTNPLENNTFFEANKGADEPKHMAPDALIPSNRVCTRVCTQSQYR